MRTRFIIATAISLLATPSLAHAQSDRELVLAAVNGFTEGLKAKDTAVMASHIDTLTRMTLLRPAPGGGSRIFLLSGREFLKLTTQPNQPAYDEPIRNPIVHIDADLATVWAEYQVRRDGKVTHCGFDSFQLARLGGKWKIINVADTYRQTGCGEAWP